GAREILLVPIRRHHVPKSAIGPRLVVADAGVDQDGMMRRREEIALDAQHELVFRVEKFRLQPRAVLVEHLLGQRREELQHLEERRLLLDDAMYRDVADL